MGSRSVGRPQKSWINTVENCSKKIKGEVWISGKQEWCMTGVNRGKFGDRPGYELEFDRMPQLCCHSNMKHLGDESLSVAKPKT